MNLSENFNLQDFSDWIEEFLPDFSRDVRKVDVSNGFTGITSISTLGESPLGVRVFVIETDKDPSGRKVGLTKDSFNLIKNYGSPNAFIAYFSENATLWRLSLLTSTAVWDEGKIITKLSNPKRQSYVLGPNAKINTPTKFLLNKGAVNDFMDLKDRFSLEVVNKEFYKEISESYTKLVGGARGEGKNKKTYDSLLKLPSSESHSQINTEFAVRLIGRVIFCWFLREKISKSGSPLMPKQLLSLTALSNYPDYYHTILEPIFFEVLNKPIKSRKEQYLDEPFSLTPYLNGGLFSPHDDDFFSYNEGKQAVYHNTVKIPDSWFVEFFEILETYNFTIDENTSIDEELSIDPEMLGRIFENLLAEINPETGESARKSTGSYYTPRVIVDFMIDESLLLYLNQKTTIDENTLRAIISYDLADDSNYPLNEEEREDLVDAIETVKILDPACGSGAFPIGALQKIVFILQQIDPDGQIWFQKQIQHTSPEIRRVIEREFSHKNFDYIRKLGIIRENIYGIDIQSIATEISRLRCFLTLVVDERVDDTLENRGVEPLPNLDFKFVTANSLVGLPTSNKRSQMGLFEDTQGIAELKEIRNMFFNASGSEREHLKLQFVQVQNKMFQRLISENRRGHADLTTMLTTWDPFAHSASSWFDPEWMFGIKDGFDIVIANPPYGLINKKQNKHISITMDEKEFELLKNSYPDANGGMINIFRFFIVQSISLLKENGCFCEIFPLSFTGDQSMNKLRKSIFNNNKIISIEAFPERDDINKRVFQPVKMSVCIMTLMKKKEESTFTIRQNHDRYVDLNNEEVPLSIQDIRLFDPKNLSIPLINSHDLYLLRKVYSTNSRFDDFSRCFDGEVHLTKYKNCITDNHQDEVLMKGAIIDRYKIRKEMSQGTIQFLDKSLYLSNNSGEKAQHHKNPRIVMQRITGVNERTRIKATIIGSDVFCANSIGYLVVKENTYDIKSILAILNSKISNYIFKLFSTNSNVNGYEIENLPFPKDFSDESLSELTDLVNKIFITMADAGYPEDKVKQNNVKNYEHKIDQLVYKLYGLTPEEIAVVEGGIKSIYES